MKKLIGIVVGIVAPALFVAGGIASSAIAQGKDAMPARPEATLVVNDKVQVQELKYRPGVNYEIRSSSQIRVVRALNGGIMQHTYADGKKEQIVWKTGEVRVLEPGPAFTTVNLGKRYVHLYVVALK